MDTGPTLPQEESHLQPNLNRVTKEKDPKKVAAGKKGAEARKKKQEVLLSQLREAKVKIHVDERNEPEHHDHSDAIISNSHDTVPENQPKTNSKLEDPVLWGIAGAALLGGFVWYSKLTTTSNQTPAVTVPKDQTLILNKKADPFIMH